MRDYTIDQLSWYKNMDLNQDIRLRFRMIATFLQENGLTTRTLLEEGAELPEDFGFRTSDLTEEGKAFVKLSYTKWVKAIDRGKLPSDVRLLVKDLAKLRSTE